MSGRKGDHGEDDDGEEGTKDNVDPPKLPRVKIKPGTIGPKLKIKRQRDRPQVDEGQ